MSGAGDSETPSQQHVAQGLAADREIRRRVERLDDGVDQRRIVARIKPEGVADRVIEAASGKIEFEVPGLLLGARLC